jgi:GDPmannose 4,6-dehydratase
MKNAIITGITGQDGAYLSKHLIDNGYKVIGTSRRPEDKQNKWRLKLLKIDKDITILRSSTETTKLLEQFQPDEVYNLEGQSSVASSFTHPHETIKSNGLSTLNWLDSIRKNFPNTKFYQASSSEIFGTSTDASKNEDSHFHPRSPYAVSKVMSHFITVNYRESYKLFACSGILFNHESPLRGNQFVTKKIIQTISNIQKGTEKKLLIGNLSSQRDWGHAKDYVEGMYKILQHSNPEDFVLSTGKLSSVRDFISLAFNFYNREIVWEGEGLSEVGICKQSNQILVEVSKEFFRPAELNVSLGNSSKAREVLNWHPSLTLENIIEDMIYFETNGKLLF